MISVYQHARMCVYNLWDSYLYDIQVFTRCMIFNYSSNTSVNSEQKCWIKMQCLWWMYVWWNTAYQLAAASRYASSSQSYFTFIPGTWFIKSVNSIYTYVTCKVFVCYTLMHVWWCILCVHVCVFRVSVCVPYHHLLLSKKLVLSKGVYSCMHQLLGLV